MAAFATMAAAEAFAVTNMENETYIVAHSCRQEDGTIAVRCLRPCANSSTNWQGDWVYVTDDGA